MPVEIGKTSFEHLANVTVFERARLVHHVVPGMHGDLTQALGRPSVSVLFQGIFYGADAADQLKTLRDAYLDQKPVDFYTEAVGEGYFTQVLISRMEIQQRAGFPDQFDYLCEVTEWVEPPQPQAASVLGGIDSDLLSEAAASVDGFQNALEEVSGLVDMLANIPSFGNPTEKLPAMLDTFKSLTGGGQGTLQSILGSLE